MGDYKIAYIADAMVKHSHNYSLIEEFKRYFDIGVFHADQQWIRNNFGGAGGEGKTFLISELLYLIKSNLCIYLGLLMLKCIENYRI